LIVSNTVEAPPCRRIGIDEQRRRAQRGAGDAQYLPGPRAIEQHAQVRDIAVGADLLGLHLDAGDDLVELPVGQPQRAAIGLRPELFPREPLRQPPACGARRIRAARNHIDMNAAHLEIAAARDRRHAALALHLRHQMRRHEAQRHHRRNGKQAYQSAHRDYRGKAFGYRHGALLAANEPKSNRQITGISKSVHD
jgi:hypothetical protein